MSSDIIWSGASELEAFLVPIDSVHDYPTNPFRGQLHAEDLGKSLRDYGQLRPILIWDNANEVDPELQPDTIIAGHHVRSGAEVQKWSHIAVVHHQFTSRDQAQAFLGIDNVLSHRKPSELRQQLNLLEAVGGLDGYSEELKETLREAATGSEMTPVADLKPHERSIRKDPIEVVEHLVNLLKEAGWTDQEVIVARDGSILVGESVLRAAAVAGIERIPVKRMDIDPDGLEAQQIMARDYALGKRAMIDERAYTDLLKQIQEEAGSLEGTGYDPEMLNLLILQSRPASEIRDINEAAEWVGLAEYSPVKLPVKHIISFEDDETRELFFEKANAAGLNLGTIKTTIGTTSGWWPHRDRQDPGSLRFVDSTKGQE